MSRADIGRMIALPAFHWNLVFYDLYSYDSAQQRDAKDKIEFATIFWKLQSRFRSVISPEEGRVSFLAIREGRDQEPARIQMENKLHEHGFDCTVRDDLLIVVTDQLEADLIALTFPGAVVEVAPPNK